MHHLWRENLFRGAHNFGAFCLPFQKHRGKPPSLLREVSCVLWRVFRTIMFVNRFGPIMSMGPLCPSHYVRLCFSGVSLAFSQGACGNARKRDVRPLLACVVFLRVLCSRLPRVVPISHRQQQSSHTRKGLCRHRYVVQWDQ